MNGDASEIPTQPWVLVVAGVTPLGRRQAVRAIAAALAEGRRVLVLDGQVPALADEDFPSTDADTNRIAVYSFGAEERTGLAARLAEPTDSRGKGRLWRTLGRRTGTVRRPMSVWFRSRPAILPLANGPAPDRIVCCDEMSITTAWKTSRIWPGVPVGSS